MISPHLGEQVLLQGNDGGFYYATQFEEDGVGQLWWYGEHGSLDFANVYFARHNPREGTAGRFSGSLINLPKGRTCGEFAMELDVVPGGGGRPTMLRQMAGPRTWEVVPPTEAALVDFTRPLGPIPPTFDGEDFDNMTGLWVGNDGGHYYVFEHPNNRRMYWFGAHPTAQPGPAGVSGRGFANVFQSHLSREYTYVSGTYVDLPRGGTSARGRIILEMLNDDPHRIVITSAPRGFGLRELRRLDPTRVQIRWNSLTIADQDDSWPWLEGDEPMLDVAVARMDGTTVDARDLVSASARLYTQSTRELGSELREGTTVTRLQLSETSLTLKPVPGDVEGSRQVLAIYVAAWDKDFSPSGDRADLFAAWRAILQVDLDRNLRAGSPTDVATFPTRIMTRFRWFADDRLGDAAIAFTWSQLMSIARSGGSMPLTFDINHGGDGNYVLRATLTVEHRLVDACTARVRRR